MEYERNPKKWVNGDTFYYKVEDKNSIFYDKYLIFVKCNEQCWGSETCHIPNFWIMVTKDDNLPSTLEEIENLEYIRTSFTTWEFRFMPFLGEEDLDALFEERSKVEFFPDEYNYLYTYQIGIAFTRKSTVPDEFKYLGNFDIKGPSDEYIPFLQINIDARYWKQILEKLEWCYPKFNYQQGDMYKEDVCKEIHERDKKAINFSIDLNNNFIFNKNKDDKVTAYNKDMGYKLYDSDVTLDVKDKYQSINKKDKSGEEITQIIFDEFSDYLSMEDDKNLVIMALADLLMKSKKLTKKVKEIALIAIEKDLKYWHDNHIFLYQGREYYLEKLKKRLEKYEF